MDSQECKFGARSMIKEENTSKQQNNENIGLWDAILFVCLVFTVIIKPGCFWHMVYKSYSESPECNIELVTSSTNCQKMQHRKICQSKSGLSWYCRVCQATVSPILFGEVSRPTRRLATPKFGKLLNDADILYSWNSSHRTVSDTHMIENQSEKSA